MIWRQHDPPRTKRLWFRLTQEESTALASNAAGAGMTVSDYVRGLILGEATRPVAKAGMPLETAELVRALTRIGVNLNIIAEKLAGSGALPRSPSLDEVIQAILSTLASFR